MALSFVKIVPISYIEIIQKDAHVNFDMGAILHSYATVQYPRWLVVI